MKTSCGILIVNEFKEILMGHSTGNKFFDIPKGMIEEGESPLQCAIRECKEETSLEISNLDLKNLGIFKYNKEKNLYLFSTEISKSSIGLDSLVCTSMFEHYYSKKILPEVDYFKWIKFNEVDSSCAKSMAKLLNSIEQNFFN